MNRNLAKDLNIRKTTESKLNDLGIYSPIELVNYRPYRYADYTDLKKIYQCNKDDNVTILGKVVDVKKVNFSRRMSSCSATITDDTGFLDVIWYGQPYLASKYKKGKVILVSGKITKYKNKIQLTNPETELTPTPLSKRPNKRPPLLKTVDLLSTPTENNVESDSTEKS